jgi:cytochrome P450
MFHKQMNMGRAVVSTEEMASERDYFSDHSILRDPYAFFEDMRAMGPVHRQQRRGVVFVTGFKESIEVLNNTDDFSSVISAPGAGAPLPFEPAGDDITGQLEQHRPKMMAANLLVTYDGTKHAAARSLLTKLFTPSRLKSNEAYMQEYGDQLAREVAAKGHCELINDIATPYVTLVIADLLGVPAEDRDLFRKIIDAGPPPGDLDTVDKPQSSEVVTRLAEYFVRYIQDRRDNPRADILTEFANAKFPDGSTPELMETVFAAVFLFGAGQDTSAKLIGNAMRFIVESPELQRTLRANRSLIPGFLEEVLRLEGSSKITSRLALRRTKIGDMEVPAGTKVLIALAAANRDPRRWEQPEELQLDRPRIREHLAFGRGAHTCIGAPLARAEVRVIFDRLLEHTTDIRLSEQHHGKAPHRKLTYEASFIIRGLENLQLELTPRE